MAVPVWAPAKGLLRPPWTCSHLGAYPRLLICASHDLRPPKCLSLLGPPNCGLPGILSLRVLPDLRSQVRDLPEISLGSPKYYRVWDHQGKTSKQNKKINKFALFMQCCDRRLCQSDSCSQRGRQWLEHLKEQTTRQTTTVSILGLLLLEALSRLFVFGLLLFFWTSSHKLWQLTLHLRFLLLCFRYISQLSLACKPPASMGSTLSACFPFGPDVRTILEWTDHVKFVVLVRVSHKTSYHFCFCNHT